MRTRKSPRGGRKDRPQKHGKDVFGTSGHETGQKAGQKNPNLGLDEDTWPQTQQLLTVEEINQYPWKRASELRGRVESFPRALSEYVFNRLCQWVSPARKNQLELQTESLRAQNDALQKRNRTIFGQLIPWHLTEIERCQLRITQRRAYGMIDPLEYGMSAVFLMIVTLYLSVFYAAATFVAFFWSPIAERGARKAFDTVFKANAFELAWQEGGTALLFMVLISGVFLTSAFLLYKKFFSEERARLGYVLLALAIAGYDGLIAYHAGDKLHQARRASGDWTFQSAINDSEFLLVLWGGMVVTVVWAATMYFFMEARRKARPVRMLREHIRQHEAKIKQLESEREKNLDQIGTNEAVIRVKERAMKGQRLELDYVMGKVDFFALEWIRYIEAEPGEDNVSERIADINKFVRGFKEVLEKHFTPFDPHDNL